ncbi:zinc ABC transporter ATP-binding protein AztA [Aquibium sp. ELW1220]|uniref:zinc ABC transporter ATP-binding protein AztA n=1 Tax=Aquibium sp. ELW1220 TaxID=2976766 RepID=UPI0025B199F8|nr:zinc ABC transporter ATP-binding protein AztA [Aquibium sp. ELW1220]MDN2581386.1 zinc ABC transporter ATP-binding protein AztA [Aquibium sp. ELW1220]
MTEPVLAFRDLTLGYDRHPAVHHLTGDVARGSLTAVVGPNGSGKSTLMKGIVGVLAPLGGEVGVAPGTRIAYLAQQSEIDRSFPARVIDLVRLGLWGKRGLLGRYDRTDHANCRKALQAVGLDGFQERPLDTLSGGQLQRALFARVLVQDADLILLDEPFNAIDANTVADLVALIRLWHGEERTILVVAHDLDLVRRHFPQTLILSRRKVAWGPTSEVLIPENLARARNFDEAWSDDAPWCEPDHAHGGEDEPHAHHHHGEEPHSHAARPGTDARPRSLS